MPHEVRRRDRVLVEAEARAILARAEYGIMATVGADGSPYAVPLNHVLCGNVLYLHCATEGHKLENIFHEERVSFCAVASARVLPEKMSTLYESAVVFGRAATVNGAAEKRKALEALAGRFYCTSPEEVEKSIASNFSRTAVIRIEIDRITGKAHREG